MNAKPFTAGLPEPAPASSFRYAHTHTHRLISGGAARVQGKPVLPSALKRGGVSRLARCTHTQTMVNEPALAAAAASKATQLRG